MLLAVFLILNEMDLKDLKIISKNELKKAKEEFGILLCDIEFAKNNPETKKVDMLRLLKKAIEFRDTLRSL